ncbi:MAG: hypothetical protein J1E39_02600 [Eubacterium sp.]|nr:hypothetical protein [Eubacterium sp.]
MNRKIKTITAAALCVSLLAGCAEETVGSTASVPESSSQGESSTQQTESSDAGSGDIIISFPGSDDESSVESSGGQDSDVSGEVESGDKELVGVDGVETNGLLKMTDSEGHVWGISFYGGGSGDDYAAYLNEFKKKVGDTVNVFNMVVPTQSAFYLPEKFESYNASHLNSINNIANQLEGIINVDAYSALEEHKNEYIYTRTDHHWMPLGAYYAAKAFCEMAQIEIKDLDEYEKKEIEGFVGTMYRFSGYDVDIKNDPETFIYYKPSTDYTATYYTTEFKEDYSARYLDSIFIYKDDPGESYTMFLGGDEKIVKIETENKNGRKLCVFKDSYGNAEIPFFVDGFEEIYVCDVRYFDNLNGPDFVKDNGITDVLFTMCTFSAVGENAERMGENLLGK